jgi:hypothetical protein
MLKRFLPHIFLTMLVAEIIVLSACGGGGGNPHPISVAITNPASAPTIQQTQTVNITASVANDPNNKGVTWTLSGVGTLSAQTTTSVTYNAPATVGSNTNVTVTATSIADNTKSATLTVTVTPPPPITVTINSKISSIIAGAAAVNFTATVMNDSANAGVTWSLLANSSNCDPACGSLSNVTTTSVTYTPPATVPASPNNTPMLVATSVTDNTKSDSDAFTIVSFASANNGELNGQYAFLIGGFDDATGGQFAYIGSFTANGTGGITTGIEDLNLPSSSGAQSLAIQGSYSLGADNRGTLTFADAGGLTKFAFSAGAASGGVVTKLHIIEFDDNTGTNGRRGSGVAYLQDPTAFALSGVNGSYAVQLTGQANGTAGTRSTNIGQFSASSGTVTGTLDTNSNGSFSSGNAFAGTLSAGANLAYGRLTYLASSGGIGNAAVYIVSASRFLAMTTGAESSNGLISGVGVQQATSNFTNSSLSGPVVLYSTGLSSVAGKSYAQAGVLTFDSNTGTGTISLDTNDGSTAGSLITTFTYSVAADGQVTITPATGPAPDLYLMDTNKAFMIDNGSLVNAGLVDPQSAGPFSNGSVSGNYFFGLAEYEAVTAGGVSSGVVTSAGGGTATATLDHSAASGTLAADQTQAITLTLADAGLGRFTDNIGDVIYIVSPTEYVAIEATANDPSVRVFEQ